MATISSAHQKRLLVLEGAITALADESLENILQVREDQVTRRMMVERLQQDIKSLEMPEQGDKVD